MANTSSDRREAATSAKRCLVAAIASLVVLACNGPARAQTQDGAATSDSGPLSDVECVERAATTATAAGGRVGWPARLEFLGEKDSRAIPYTLDMAGCVGFIAVGHGQVKDIDLALHADSGVLLARDTAQDAHPYVRYCGAAGLSLRLVTHMYEGRGEIALLTVLDAPAELAALADALQGCTRTVTDERALMDVGPEPEGPTLAETFQSTVDRLARVGYRPDRVLADGALTQRQRARREVELKAGTCYAVTAIGDSGVEDIDLRVLSTGERPRVLGEDTGRDRQATVKFCPESAGVTLDIRMYAGQGRFQVHAFALGSLPFVVPPAGLEGASRIGFTEMLLAMAQRTMAPVRLVWALAEPAGRIVLPIAVTADRCYALGAVVGPDLIGADLDLRLVDGGGRLVAWDLGTSDQPLMFHCATHDQVLRVWGEVHGTRAPGRFLLIVAEDGSSAGEKS